MQDAAIATARFWEVWQDEATTGALLAHLERHREAIGIANLGALRAIWRRHHRLEGGLVRRAALPRDFPAPALRLWPTDFAPDFLVLDGTVLVSRRFREIAGLPGPEAQCIAVDDAECHEAARAQGYAMLWLFAEREGLDLERSDYEMRNVEMPRLSYPSFRRMVFREGFEPGVPLFVVPQSAFLFATEALAGRMAAAGITGVAFRDRASAPGEAGYPLRPG